MISQHDRGLLYGDGVFETVRYCGGKLRLWTRHRDRLSRSCKVLQIPLHLETFDKLVAGFIVQAPSPDCILKVIVTRGEGGRGYAPPKMVKNSIVLQWHNLPPDIETSAREGIDCFYCDHPLSLNPVTAGIKHLNRLDQVMASLQLSRAAEFVASIKEGLMSDVHGNVVEGTRCNIFAVIDNTLCTPDLSSAGVEGVMRSFLIDHINAAGIALEIRPIRKHELSLASELFVCNSVLGVWPVRRILCLENHATDAADVKVEVEFPSRQMSTFVMQAVQDVFCL